MRARREWLLQDAVPVVFSAALAAFGLVSAGCDDRPAASGSGGTAAAGAQGGNGGTGGLTVTLTAAGGGGSAGGTTSTPLAAGGSGGVGGTGGIGAGGTGGVGAGGTGGIGAGGAGAGGEGGGMMAQVVPDFELIDVNPNSMTSGLPVSPRDYLGKVSAWYFGHST